MIASLQGLHISHNAVFWIVSELPTNRPEFSNLPGLAAAAPIFAGEAQFCFYLSFTLRVCRTVAAQMEPGMPATKLMEIDPEPVLRPIDERRVNRSLLDCHPRMVDRNLSRSR